MPVGYMYKKICRSPKWLKSAQVTDIYSVSPCISEDFADWINYWKHNGYWFFDSPEVMKQLAKDNDLSLEGMCLFFYLAYEKQWDEEARGWVHYFPEKSLPTNVVPPIDSRMEGYDIVSFCCQTSAEYSPLSCNYMAEKVDVNEHCLVRTFEDAQHLAETFKDCEPGPYRIFEVHTVKPNPAT